MINPWLKIPLADYEGHMASPAVCQASVLSDLFASVLASRKPASVAIFGIAGGNGLEQIDRSVTKRIVGLDIQASDLDAVGRRYRDLPGLELHAIDLAGEIVSLAPVELVHAALIFEHAGCARCLDNAVAMVAADGALSVVLQLPGEPGEEVGRTGFTSLQTLAADFTFIDPIWMSHVLRERGLFLLQEKRQSLPAGKAFWMGLFARS
jgi:hypothetical protein